MTEQARGGTINIHPDPTEAWQSPGIPCTRQMERPRSTKVFDIPSAGAEHSPGTTGAAGTSRAEGLLFQSQKQHAPGGKQTATETNPSRNAGARASLARPLREITQPHTQCGDKESQPRYSTLLIKKEGKTIWNERTLCQTKGEGEVGQEAAARHKGADSSTSPLLASGGAGFSEPCRKGWDAR